MRHAVRHLGTDARLSDSGWLRATGKPQWMSGCWFIAEQDVAVAERACFSESQVHLVFYAVEQRATTTLRETSLSDCRSSTLDNDRYPGIRWTTVRDVLSESRSQGPK